MTPLASLSFAVMAVALALCLALMVVAMLVGVVFAHLLVRRVERWVRARLMVPYALRGRRL